jgi:hypothetical protein
MHVQVNLRNLSAIGVCDERRWCVTECAVLKAGREVSFCCNAENKRNELAISANSENSPYFFPVIYI